MKKLIGIVISILTIVTANISAQAATVRITKADVKDANTVSVRVSVTDSAPNSQYTVLVTKADAKGNYTLDNAVYINQLKSGEYTLNGNTVSFDMDIAIDKNSKYQLKVGATQAIQAAAETVPYRGLYGDADTDGILTATDSAYVMMYSLNPGLEPEVEFELLDVDNSGEIDTNDAKLILKKVLDSSAAFPAEKQ